MTPPSCRAVRRALGAFVDGELSGAAMLRTSSHIESCGPCAEILEDFRNMGTLLRAGAQATDPAEFAGLADGIVTRRRAEAAQSWPATLRRGVGDWHWAIVGLGSVVATCLLVAVVSAVLMFGPAPQRSDSLAGVMKDLSREQSLSVFIIWNSGVDRDGMLAGIVNGGRLPRQAGGVLPDAAFLGGPSERELVGALSETFGRGLVDLRSMGEDDRRFVDFLMEGIKSKRTSMSQVLLMSTTTVSASGL